MARTTALQRFLMRAVPFIGCRLVACRLLVGRSSSFVYGTGWMESLRRGYPCKPDGSPLPWMNLSVVSLLEERLGADFDIFEWGSGYSTLYFASRVRSVTSVEYDNAWLERVGRQAPANVRILFRADDVGGGYCGTILEDERQYDLVVVDGRDRVNCVRNGLSRLNARGVLLLDDAQRERYAAAVQWAESLGFRSLTLEGVKPGSHRIGRTKIFYRTGNCFGL